MEFYGYYIGHIKQEVFQQMQNVQIPIFLHKCIVSSYPLPTVDTQCGKKLFLALSTLWANSADDAMKIFFLFSLKIGFGISCKLSPMETICMKCQTLFSEKQKRKIFQNVI